MKFNLGIRWKAHLTADKIRSSLVSFRARYGRGWGLVGDYIKQPAVALTALSYWFDKLGYPLEYIWLLIPLWFLGWYCIGWFDQFKMKLWQEEAQWGSRNIDPFQQEVLTRIKNIEEKVNRIEQRERC